MYRSNLQSNRFAAKANSTLRTDKLLWYNNEDSWILLTISKYHLFGYSQKQKHTRSIHTLTTGIILVFE